MKGLHAVVGEYTSAVNEGAGALEVAFPDEVVRGGCVSPSASCDLGWCTVYVDQVQGTWDAEISGPFAAAGAATTGKGSAADALGVELVRTMAGGNLPPGPAKNLIEAHGRLRKAVVRLREAGKEGSEAEVCDGRR